MKFLYFIYLLIYFVTGIHLSLKLECSGGINHSSLQPHPPGLKGSLHLSLPGSWNYGRLPPRQLAIFVFIVETGFQPVVQAGL